MASDKPKKEPSSEFEDQLPVDHSANLGDQKPQELPADLGADMAQDLQEADQASHHNWPDFKNERRQERRGSERRDGDDRRASQERRVGGPTDYCGPERRQNTDRRDPHKDRRQCPNRRLDGLTGRRDEDRKEFQDRIENGELTLEEVEFIRAIDRYKRKFNRPFPSWSEILLVIKQLGYTKDSL